MKSSHDRYFNFMKVAILTMFMLLSMISLSALTLINENISNWTAHASYGNFTQTIPAGTVSLTSCLVQPNAVASGTGSSGRLQLQQSTGIVQFPELASIGQVEFHFAAGSSGRSVLLQKLNGSTWEEITIFTGIAATGATYSYDVNLSSPTTIRLANPSHALYIHDIIVTDYQSTELPIVTTSAVSGITYNTAISGGDVENSGTTSLTAKGVCWNTSQSPDLSNNFTSDGTGIGTFTSNITGLTEDTDYYVRAYATNGSGTSYGNEVQFHSGNIGVPTLQAALLTFYPGNTSIEVIWTPGNGAKRIVKINTTSSFTAPVNGINYTANTIYSGAGEQVIYNGATQIIEGEAINAVTVTNLTTNTVYWFRIYDYNGDGSTIQYNTQTAISNPNFTTTLNSIVTGYYAGITGTGTTLKTNLSNLIRTTHATHFSYDALWTQLQYTDEDSTNTNNIIEEYTGWSIPKSYYGGGTSQWNREHTWSKSHGDFGESAPAGTDLHHLRPADATVNSSKGNKDFDDGGNPVTDNSPYGSYSGVTGCYTDTDSWEPRAAEKGDIARMIFYMAVRYEGVDTSYNLEMVDTTPSTTSSAPYYGKLSTLLQWHMQDPPDSWEMRRNNRIQERQGNRNPFIDHPEFVNMIWAPTTTAATIVDSVSFRANWTSAVNASSYYLDVATDSQFTSFVPGFQNLNVNNVTSYVVTGLTTNQNYFYRLRSFFTTGYSMYSNVTAFSISTLPIELSSFTAILSNEGNVTLYWTTQSEQNVIGFSLYRGLTANLANAENITATLIPATNTSTEQNYNFTDVNTTPGATYYYWLKNSNLDGSVAYHGPISIYITANDDNTTPQLQTGINRIYPNPFHQTTSVDLSLSKAENIQASIYNLKGQCVKTLFSGVKSAGQHSLSWNGKDTNGNGCTPGIYFMRLNSGNHISQKKLILY